jgi:hypothetical protein
MAKACVNPNCKSRGQVHPNCRCHGGMAEGGVVSDFCSTGRAHKQGCMYAEGGNVGQPAMFDDLVADPTTLPSFDSLTPDSQTYGTAGQQAITALEGFGQGVAGPLAPMAEEALGVDPKAILARRLANPITAGTAEIAGLVGPALLTGGASAAASTGAKLSTKGALAALAKYTQAGLVQKAANVVLPGAGTTLAGRIGIGAAKAALENGILSGSDEISKMVLNDPDQTAESAIAHIGLGAALGGVLGGTVTSAGLALEKAGPKVSRFIENFKGRLSEHAEGGDPVSNVTKELSEYHAKISGLHDDVYGPNGLKSKDINKALPEMNEKIAQQGIDTYGLVNKEINKMVEKPNSYPARLVDQLRNDLDQFESAVSKPEVTSADIFTAKQDLKQRIQAYAKFDKQKTILDPEYEFVESAKTLSNKIRTALEDTEVWGKAGDRQAAINKAFSEYNPTLKDFQKKFMSDLNGEKVIDQGKIATYLNQLENPRAELKKEVLKNFIEKTESYKKVIADSHANLGLEAPVEDSALNSVLSTFDKKTSGSKAADFIAHKFAPQALGTAAGASVGGFLAGPTGGAIGALLGKEALAPFFNSVLPSLIKFLGSKPANAPAAKAAVDLVTAAAKEQLSLNKAVKEVFKVLPSRVDLTPHNTGKLDKELLKFQKNPSALLDKPQPAASYYMPDHISALDQATARAFTYLNSIRPVTDKQAPLDSSAPVDAVRKAEFQNALVIAQTPTVVLDKLRAGVLTQQDLNHLTAMYPGLYSSMKTKLTDQLVTMGTKKEAIPYKLRNGLSLLLGQPLDSTMMPSSIVAAQSTSRANREAKQNQQGGMGNPGKGAPGNPSLQKMPTLFASPAATRQFRMQKP